MVRARRSRPARARGQPRDGRWLRQSARGSGTVADRGLTAVAGLKVGHHTLDGRPTGCTVVIAEAGAVGGVDVRGGAPGTRDTELLNPVNTVERGPRDRALRRQRVRPGGRRRRDEISRRTAHRIRTSRRGRADRARGDPVRSRGRRRHDSSRRRVRIRRRAGGGRRTGRGRQRRRRRGRDGRQVDGVLARDERRARERGDSAPRRPGRRRARRGQRGRQRDRSGNRALHCRRADRGWREHRGPARVAAERAGGRAAGPWKTRRSQSWPPTRR